MTRLWKVLPVMAMSNGAYSAFADSERSGKLSMAHASIASVPDEYSFKFAELGNRAIFTKWHLPVFVPPTLFCHVFHIIGMCPNKQMRWITAAWNIAPMEDKHAIRNRATGNFPRDAVGQAPMAFVVRYGNAYDSIAKMIEPPCEAPARADEVGAVRASEFFAHMPAQGCYNAFVDHGLLHRSARGRRVRPRLSRPHYTTIARTGALHE